MATARKTLERQTRPKIDMLILERIADHGGMLDRGVMTHVAWFPDYQRAINFHRFMEARREPGLLPPRTTDLPREDFGQIHRYAVTWAASRHLEPAPTARCGWCGKDLGIPVWGVAMCNEEHASLYWEAAK